MILNQSADYALRAVLYLAGCASPRAQNAEVIASALGVPRNYLSKVLHLLARSNVLRSTRGPRGGFRLARTPDQIVLASVIAPFQIMPARNVCLLGNRVCDTPNPCLAHERWRAMANPVSAFFQNTTIEHMLGEAP